MKRTTLSGELPKQSFIARTISEKKAFLVEVIAALFILLFAYTAANKLISLRSLRYVLKEYPLIGNISEFVAWALPLTELFVVALLFFPKTRLAGFYGTLALMLSFTFYLIYLLFFTPQLPCTCGGMLQQLSWPQHLVFNIIFTLLSIFGIRLSKQKNRLDQNNL